MDSTRECVECIKEVLWNTRAAGNGGYVADFGSVLFAKMERLTGRPAVRKTTHPFPDRSEKRGSIPDKLVWDTLTEMHEITNKLADSPSSMKTTAEFHSRMKQLLDAVYQSGVAKGEAQCYQKVN